MKSSYITNESDKDLLNDKGIGAEQVELQIKRFNEGFPPLNVIRPATQNDGIAILSEEDTKKYEEKLSKETEAGLAISKFVPASGAATRMFKDLYQYLENPEPLKKLASDHPIVRFIELLPRFAFFPLLVEKLKTYNLNNVHVRKSKAGEIIEMLLKEEGLNYGNLPKGLIHFHKYNESIRTAMEEHLVEGSRYATTADGLIKVHFTVSPEHHEMFKEKLYQEGPQIENMFEVGLDVSFSYQKPHTDTIAVTPDNEPFRDESGQLVFRPGGHGALIANLNELESELVFIKNIDNVVPVHLLPVTELYKKAIGGLLLEIRDSIFGFLNQLDDSPDQTIFENIKKFIKERLHTNLSDSFNAMNNQEQLEYLKKYLNRPIRVCGMVKDEGEPGGGPFWIKDTEGQESLQILEASQINMDDTHQAAQLTSSTHFNSVDLACYIRNYKGEKFNLTQYTDPETGFISEKSINGRPLKALELPGLWNGAMADWITLFVEVPIETFNPVKTVNDLLRPQHQPHKGK